MEKIKCPLGHEQELTGVDLLHGHGDITCLDCGVVFNPNITGRDVLKRYLKGKTSLKKFLYSTGPFGAKSYDYILVYNGSVSRYLKNGWERV